MTLSDKIMYQMGDEELDDDLRVIYLEDVREFIKDIERSLGLIPPYDPLWLSSEVMKKIKELAGEELTKEGKE